MRHQLGIKIDCRTDDERGDDEGDSRRSFRPRRPAGSETINPDTVDAEIVDSETIGLETICPQTIAGKRVNRSARDTRIIE